MCDRHIHDRGLKCAATIPRTVRHLGRASGAATQARHMPLLPIITPDSAGRVWRFRHATLPARALLLPQVAA